MTRVLMVFQTPKRGELYANTLPPLGLLGIASFLEQKDFPTDVIDCHVQPLTVSFAPYDVIFFAVNIANIEHTMETIKKIRMEYPEKKIILGGPQSPGRAKHFMEYKEVDAIIIGEGEYTAYEYLSQLDKSKIKGLMYRDAEGKTVFTGERKLIYNLDELPPPALDKVPIEKYNVAIKQAHPISSLVSSRGCPNECIFCFHSRIWRQRSAKHVVDEIEWQVRKLGVKEICVNDDNFTLNYDRAEKICDMIIDRGIKVKIQLKNGIRVDKIDKPLLAKLKQAGIWLIAVAPETGENESLIKIKKDFDLERVKLVVQWCKDLDIKTMAFFMIGFPWETKENIENTIDYAHNLNTDFCQFTRVVPIEGTPLYDSLGIKPIDEFSEKGTHHGKPNHTGLQLSEEEVEKLVKKAFRKIYLNPRRISRILRILSWRDIAYLAKFAFASGSM